MEVLVRGTVLVGGCKRFTLPLLFSTHMAFFL